MKDLKIRFGSGREVLNAYWGYLSDGGLVIADQELELGESVLLEVHVESTRTDYALVGTVVKRGAGQLVVRFSPGEPHDMLLTDALSEADNVPARRHRRYRVERPSSLTSDGAELATRLIDVSDEGCCIQLAAGDSGSVRVGERVTLSWDGVTTHGKVVWARHTERGVEFDVSERPRLREYVGKLAETSRRAGRDSAGTAPT